jgi:hypothetical protein
MKRQYKAEIEYTYRLGLPGGAEAFLIEQFLRPGRGVAPFSAVDQGDRS